MYRPAADRCRCHRWHNRRVTIWSFRRTASRYGDLVFVQAVESHVPAGHAADGLLDLQLHLVERSDVLPAGTLNTRSTTDV